MIRDRARTLLLYLASTAIASGTPYLINIAIARVLGPNEAGLVTIFMTLLSGGAIAVGLNAYTSVQARYFHKRERFSEYLSSAVWFMHAMFLVVLIASVASLFFIDQFYGLPAKWLWIVVVVACGQNMSMLVLLLLQADDRGGRYFAWQLAQSVGLVVLVFAFIRALQFGSSGYVYAQLTVSVLLLVASFAVLGREFNLRAFVDVEGLRSNLKYGLSLLPHSAASFFLLGYDRIYVAKHAGIVEAGIYGVAAQLGMLVVMVITAVNKVLIPWLYRDLADGGPRAKRVIHAGFVGVALLSLGAFVFLDVFALRFLGPRFASASGYLPWFILTGTLNGFYLLVTNILFFYEKVGFLSMVTTTSAIIKIILLLVLFERFGTLGAAVSNAVAMLFMFAATYLLAMRVFAMRRGNTA